MKTSTKNSLLERKFLRKTLQEIVTVEEAIATSPSTSLIEALSIMCDKGIGSILITEGTKLVGIFTERDLIKRIACLTHPPETFSIRDVMTPNPETLPIRASVARGVHALSVGGYRHIPVTEKEGAPLKIFSVKDIIKYIHEHITVDIVKADSKLQTGEGEVDMFFFDDLSVIKCPVPPTISESSTLEEGMQKLCSTSGGCIVVQNANNRISGIFTERDYMKKVVIKKLNLQTTRMSEVMTPSPKTLLINSSIALVINTFAEGHFRHIPIVDSNETLQGLLSVKYVFQMLAERILTDLTP